MIARPCLPHGVIPAKVGIQSTLRQGEKRVGPGIESRDDRGGYCVSSRLSVVIPVKTGIQRRDVHRAKGVLRSADASHWIPDQVGNDGGMTGRAAPPHAASFRRRPESNPRCGKGRSEWVPGLSNQVPQISQGRRSWESPAKPESVHLLADRVVFAQNVCLSSQIPPYGTQIRRQKDDCFFGFGQSLVYPQWPACRSR